MQKSKLNGVLGGLVGLALVVGGLATASNMGFKFIPSVAANRAFNLALPWNNPYRKVGGAGGLFTDLHAQDANVRRVSKFTSTFGFVDWQLGAPPANNFRVVKGEAYMVFADSSGPIDTAVVAGSHDPYFTFTFVAGQCYNLSMPYHQPFTKANQLFNDLQTKTHNAVTRISKFTSTAGFVDWYYGVGPANNFTLVPGEGVIVCASASTSGYVWPHY